MEIDRVLGELERPALPVVRFYTWNRPAISYGLNQDPLRRLKIKKCLGDGIEMVARPTGGREILHGWDLCCSVIEPIDGQRSGVDCRVLFDRINGIFIMGLNLLGIEAEYHSVAGKKGIKDGPCFSQVDRGEISVFGRKIIASAQRVFSGTVLQQSSISIDKPAFDIMDYLRIQKKVEIGSEIVNSGAYMREYMRENFSMFGIVDVFKRAFEMEMGKTGDLKLPEII